MYKRQEENVSESELTENNESDVSNTISEEETADNYSFDDEEDDFAISPEENDETAPSEQDDNADDEMCIRDRHETYLRPKNA